MHKSPPTCDSPRQETIDKKVIKIIDIFKDEGILLKLKPTKPKKEKQVDGGRDEAEKVNYFKELQTMREAYQRAMDGYFNSYSPYTNKEKDELWWSDRRTKHEAGSEAVTHQEAKDIMRKMIYGAVCGNTIGSTNYEEKRLFEVWKNSSFFNQVLSFMYFDNPSIL